MNGQLIRHTAHGRSVWLNLANATYIERRGPYLEVHFTDDQQVSLTGTEADQLEVALDERAYPVVLMHPPALQHSESRA